MEYANIRSIVFILFLVSFSWANCAGQEGIRIEKIKMECDRINKAIPTLKVAEEKIDDQSSEGGVLKKFYEANTIRKAVLSLYGESGKSIYEYYFLNGELILASQAEITYKTPIYMGKTEIESEEVDKFYFSNQKLVLGIDPGGKPIDPALYPEKEKEFLNDVKTIINKEK